MDEVEAIGPKAGGIAVHIGARVMSKRRLDDGHRVDRLPPIPSVQSAQPLSSLRCPLGTQVTFFAESLRSWVPYPATTDLPFTADAVTVRIEVMGIATHNREVAVRGNIRTVEIRGWGWDTEIGVRRATVATATTAGPVDHAEPQQRVQLDVVGCRPRLPAGMSKKATPLILARPWRVWKEVEGLPQAAMKCLRARRIACFLIELAAP
jgi:hypothetical protein